MLVLANLSCAVDNFLDWSAEPGDDECPAEVIEHLCSAQETARELLEGLGHGQEFN